MNKIFVIFIIFFSSIVDAHFTHFEPRIIHLYQENKDTVILMRMPLPLILLDEGWKGIDSQQELPYTYKLGAGDNVDYMLNGNQIKADLDTFKNFISKGYTIHKNGNIQNYVIDSIHIFNTDSRKPFSSLETAKENFKGAIVVSPEASKFFDAGIDIKLRIPNTSVVKDDISVTSLLGDKFNAINRLANIVNLHREGNNKSETTVGILDYSSTHQASLMQQLINGFSDGFSHILIGLDHVIFVLLLFYSATNVWRLLSLATAFTVGHSFSLFFGNSIAISSSLFTPSIELLIAVTICITAIALLFNKAEHLGTTPLLIIGIIHGFGFSFVFNELAMEGSQINISNLLAFNIGIEAGQIFIYGLAFVFTVFVQKYFSLIKPLRYYVSIGALSISFYWIITRSIPLVEYISI